MFRYIKDLAYQATTWAIKKAVLHFRDALIARATKTPYDPIGDYMHRYWLVPYVTTQGGSKTGIGAVSFWQRPIAWCFQKLGIGIRIHCIMQSDHDGAYHDHPWNFMSVILSGGYWEHRPLFDKGLFAGDVAERFQEGDVVFRKAGDLHRLALSEGQHAWTLFITGPWLQDWGFVENANYKTYWREYLESGKRDAAQSIKVEPVRLSGGYASAQRHLHEILDREAAHAEQAEPAPIDMVLHCPNCGQQHIDAPEDRRTDLAGDEPWHNPPHRSHLCSGCGHVWRPADVPTSGVAATKTRGQADSTVKGTLAAVRAVQAEQDANAEYELSVLLDFIVNGFGATEDHETIKAAIRRESVMSLSDAEVDAIMARIVKPRPVSIELTIKAPSGEDIKGIADFATAIDQRTEWLLASCKECGHLTHASKWYLPREAALMTKERGKLEAEGRYPFNGMKAQAAAWCLCDDDKTIAHRVTA